MLESAWKQIRCLKILEKSLNLSLANFEILHLLTILKQALVCMSPVLGNSIWFHFACLLNWIKILTVHYIFFVWIWLFVDNFGAWKMQFGSLKKSAWILYFEFATNPGWMWCDWLHCHVLPTGTDSRACVCTLFFFFFLNTSGSYSWTDSELIRFQLQDQASLCTSFRTAYCLVSGL